ncbi:MAG: ribonuclease H [Candidatus Caldatribacteriota bacterium]
MKTIILYTDGACSGNPGPGGWAYIFYVEEMGVSKTGISQSGGEKNTTNQRMELKAAIEGLQEAVFQHLENESIKIKLYTDSAYLSNCIKDEWYKKWRYNGWKNAKKEPVKNQDLWEEILLFVDNPLIKLEVIKVKGHSGNELNDKVDELAKYQISKYKE